MPLPSPVKITKAQAFQRFVRNPQEETFRMIWDMQQSIPTLVSEAVERVKNSTRSDVQDEAVKALTSVIKEQLPDMVARNVKDLMGVLKQAQDGVTPKRGVDYFTLRDQAVIKREILASITIPKPLPGKDGTTPKKGVDYYSKMQVRELVNETVKGLMKSMEKDEVLTREEITQIAKSLQYVFDANLLAAEIARGLETLQGVARLDYNALKNRPEQAVKMYEDDKIHRGMSRGGRGGTDPLPYDLTDQCNGVTKTFTIPACRRVLGVFGTEFPVQYRPTIDWTNTSTVLTLTSQVSAPAANQTLWILYVPL